MNWKFSWVPVSSVFLTEFHQNSLMTFSHISDAQITDYIVITIIIIYGLDTLDFSSINNNNMKKEEATEKFTVT